MARRGVRASPPPRRGRALSTAATSVAAPRPASGKVLDASALAAFATGSIGFGTWLAIASELSLTLLIPAAARTEALLAHPDAVDLIDVLMSDTLTVVVPAPAPEVVAQAQRRHRETGLFDPLAIWVGELCRVRAWSALSSDPDRLRRVAPELHVHPL